MILIFFDNANDKSLFLIIQCLNTEFEGLNLGYNLDSNFSPPQDSLKIIAGTRDNLFYQQSQSRNFRQRSATAAETSFINTDNLLQGEFIEKKVNEDFPGEEAPNSADAELNTLDKVTYRVDEVCNQQDFGYNRCRAEYIR